MWDLDRYPRHNIPLIWIPQQAFTHLFTLWWTLTRGLHNICLPYEGHLQGFTHLITLWGTLTGNLGIIYLYLVTSTGVYSFDYLMWDLNRQSGHNIPLIWLPQQEFTHYWFTLWWTLTRGLHTFVYLMWDLNRQSGHNIPSIWIPQQAFTHFITLWGTLTGCSSQYSFG